VQSGAILADSLPISPAARRAAYEQQLKTAGTDDDPVKRIHFLRWQTLRVAGLLHETRWSPRTPPRAWGHCSASTPTAARMSRRLDTEFGRARGELGARAEVEFLEAVLQMIHGSPFANDKRLRDLPIREALGC
jgi:hypothetical protein